MADAATSRRRPAPRWLFAAGALLIVGLAKANPTPTPLGTWAGRTPPEVIERARSVQTLPLDERIERISRPWLGRPYTNGPLGEGGGIDDDPVTRYDTFDCLTFIEEVLALALAPDPESVHYVRAGLRFRGGAPQTYENRRHFMLAEWIPGTIEEGWMEDITPDLPGAEQIERAVTLEMWSGWRGRTKFPLEDDRLPVGAQRFWYLPLDAAEAAVDQIPPGSVIFTLREVYPHMPIAVTHVGVTVPAETPTMRHASRMGERVVRDDGLLWYIKHLRTYTNWPSKGIIVLAPQEYGPRPFAVPSERSDVVSLSESDEAP